MSNFLNKVGVDTKAPHWTASAVPRRAMTVLGRPGGGPTPAPTPAIAIMSGFLKKKSPTGLARMKLWQNRFFVLHEHALLYFKKKGVKPVGALPIDLMHSVVRNEKEAARFDVHMLGSGEEHDSTNASVVGVDRGRVIRTFCLRAPSPQECTRWVEALRSYMRRAQRLAGEPPTPKEPPKEEKKTSKAPIDLLLVEETTTTDPPHATKALPLLDLTGKGDLMDDPTVPVVHTASPRARDRRRRAQSAHLESMLHRPDEEQEEEEGEGEEEEEEVEEEKHQHDAAQLHSVLNQGGATLDNMLLDLYDGGEDGVAAGAEEEAGAALNWSDSLGGHVGTSLTSPPSTLPAAEDAKGTQRYGNVIATHAHHDSVSWSGAWDVRKE